jgi:hypothetical protein
VQAARIRRLRRVMLGALVVAVVAGAASAVVALSGGDGDQPAARSTAAGPPAAGSGAALADPDRTTEFLAAAGSDIVAVTTFDYRRLDDALTAGLAVTTGAYRQSFRAALTGSLAASARANHTVHDFQVLAVGIGEMDAAGDTAKVLILGRQLVTDRSARRPRASVLALAATMRRDGDRYLISELAQDAGVGTPVGTPQLAQAIAAGRRAVSGAVAVAVQDASGATVHLLVAATGRGGPTGYQVTVTRTGTTWRATGRRAVTGS